MWPPLRKLFAPPGVQSWLRDWSAITQVGKLWHLTQMQLSINPFYAKTRGLNLFLSHTSQFLPSVHLCVANVRLASNCSFVFLYMTLQSLWEDRYTAQVEGGQIRHFFLCHPVATTRIPRDSHKTNTAVLNVFSTFLPYKRGNLFPPHHKSQE